MTANDSKDPTDMPFVLALFPGGVEARSAAVNVGIGLLTELAAALRAEIVDDDVKSEVEDARVNIAELHVANIALSLVQGITALLPANVYAANALLRQLVEVEYLAWACAHAPAEITKWLTSDRQERLDRWSPSKLRARAGQRFNAEDYWSHCEVGGHPTAAGGWLLFGPSEQYPQFAAMPEVTMYETTLHLTAVCDYLAHGVPRSVERQVDGIARAHDQRATWQSTDPLSQWSRLHRELGEGDASGAVAELLDGVAESLAAISSVD